MDKIDSVSVEATPHTNSGEALIFEVDLYDNGDDSDNVFTIMKMTLESYGNSAMIMASDVTPEVLRLLADKLEVKIKEHTRG